MEKRVNADLAKKFYDDINTICYIGVRTVGRTGDKLWYRKCENPSFTYSNHYVVLHKDDKAIIDWFDDNRLLFARIGTDVWFKYKNNVLNIDTDLYKYKKEKKQVWTYKIRHEQDNIVEEGGSISKSSIYSAVDSLEVGQTISITKVED